MNKKLAILCSFTLFILFSCKEDNRYYEKNVDISVSEWDSKQVPTLTFDIVDTSVAYHLVYSIRNDASYPYYNLYLKSELIDSTDLIVDSFESELYLFDATSGKPHGEAESLLSSSIGDVFDGRYLCQSYYKFPRPGNYSFLIKQNMRGEKPLQGILAVGLRIEKVN